MSHPEFPTQMRSMISNFSCKVFMSKNATEMSKTRLKKRKLDFLRQLKRAKPAWLVSALT